MRSLVRIEALQAFEASARHGSFVGAAGELNVTPAAVGQLVRSLEGWLGAPRSTAAPGPHGSCPWRMRAAPSRS